MTGSLPTSARVGAERKIDSMTTESNEWTTTDLAEFGARERYHLHYLLSAWQDHGLPHGFYASGVVPMLNKSSGRVFLTNEDYQVAICVGGTLELWHSLPSGNEGTLEELLAEVNDTTDPDDLEYLSGWCYDQGVCPVCADPADYCQGHGSIGDPDGYARLRLFSEYV